MEMAMDYRYTDTNKATAMIDMTMGDIAELRDVLIAAHKVELQGVSKWTVRRMIKTLAEVQAKAAETMAFDAKMLAEAAKLPDDL
jgi:hypothetical protein